MDVRIWLFITILGVVLSYQLSDDYESKSAEQKRDEMWNILKASEAASGRTVWTFQKFLTIFQVPTWNATASMDRRKDTSYMPYGRNKLIHVVASVAKGTYKSVGDHKYTGMFQGENLVMIRIGSGFHPRFVSFVAGGAVKWYRDGVPAANIMILDPARFYKPYCCNYFRYNMSNHIPIPPSTFGRFWRTTFSSNFHETSPPARMVGLSDIASTHMNGTEIAKKDMNFPYETKWVPNAELQEKFDDYDTIERMYQIFDEIPAGTKLWDVYAREDPNDFKWKKIAETTTTSEFTSSDAGDRFLFFRHQRMQDDVDLRPDWHDAVFDTMPVDDPEDFQVCPGMLRHL